MESLKFNALQLKKARIARGMTMKDLAKKADVSRQMISNYEMGKTTPKGSTLIRLINVLDFPSSFFSEEYNVSLHGPTFFRKKNAATKKIRSMQSIRLEFQKRIFDTLSEYINFPKINLPSMIDCDVQDITDKMIIEKARETRLFWNISKDEPIDNVIQVLETNGIIVVEANMTNDSLDAVSQIIEERPFILLADNHESSVRRRFNVAHELGHILLHNGVESIEDYTSQELKNIIEKQANLFASEFLMPTEAFEKKLLSTSLEYYIDIKSYWKVSIQAMIYKTFQLDLINEDQKLYLNKKISFNKWKKREPLDDQIHLEEPTLFNVAYSMIVDNGVVDSTSLFFEIDLPKDEIEKSLKIEIDEHDFEYHKPELKLVKRIC